jgi:hypothetical protein
MSVDRTDYIVYGWKLPYEMKNSKGDQIDFWDDKFLPMIEGHEDEAYSLIIDGMMGEYTVFGIVIEQDEDGNGWDFVHLSGVRVNHDHLKDKYREIFDVEGEVADPYLFIFSHFH